MLGLLVGVFNGIAVAWLRVNPFVATLASMNICLGIGTSLSDGHPVFGIPEEFNVAGYRLHVLGIPMSIIYAVAVGIALHVLLQYTVVGRSFYVLGSNPRAAIVAGWPRRRLLALAYILSALLTAVGALILTARAASGAPNLGGGLSLQTIAAAVIGGVSLTRRTWRIKLGGNWLVLHYHSFEWHEPGGYRRLHADASHGRDRHLCRCARPHCPRGRVGAHRIIGAPGATKVAIRVGRSQIAKP